MSDTQTILVIEDELPLQKAIKIKLESEGFEVLTARAVDQAVEYLKTIPTIKAIWLDHYLLGKDTGLDLVAKIKGNDSPWNKISIFVVSNTATPEKVQSYMQLGIDKYYTKSNFRLDQIINDLKTELAK